MATATMRSVIQVGDSLCVTLPKPWAQYYHIKRGERLVVIEDKVLKIRPNVRRKSEVDKGEPDRVR